MARLLAAAAAAAAAAVAAVAASDASQVVADDECAVGSDCGLAMLQRRGRRSEKARPPEPQRRFLVWLSDMHMDPYYGVEDQWDNSSAVCSRFVKLSAKEAKEHPYGVRPCDPPSALWRSALEAAREVSGGAELAIFTGDFARHKQNTMPNPWEDTTRALADVSGSFAKTFGGDGPERLVLGTLGNDDSPDNYYLDVEPEGGTNPWLANVASVLSGDGSMSQKRAAEYKEGGFFEARLPDTEGVRILSLNTIMYSTLHKPVEPRPEDPFGQFAWLRERLEDAVSKGDSVWIVGHIPPGIETFGYTTLWRKQYVKPYLDIVQDPKLGPAIRAQLFGHVHADEFRLLPEAPPGAGPVLLTGSISPIFESNPTFRVVEYDRVTGRLLNVKVYWADIDAVVRGEGPRWKSGYDAQGPKWKFGYDFLGAYPTLRKAVQESGGLTNQAFVDLRDALRSSAHGSGEIWQTYASWYKMQCVNDLTCVASDQNGLSAQTRTRFKEIYLCALTIARHSEFAACASEYARRGLEDREPFDDSALGASVEAFSDARAQHWKSVAAPGEETVVAQRCGHVLRTVRLQ